MPSGENFLAQLKAVIDPMTVFSHYLSFKKAGSRYRALCPFHTEKTPSFYASENGMFHCFGCSQGGDVIKFVMLMEKLDFKECVQLLSSRYGVPLKFSSGVERKEKEELQDLLRQTAEFYQNLLSTHPSGKAALQYLEDRGVEKDTIRKFQIGWAPASWNSLVEHFHKRDVNPALLEKCGLVIPRQGEGYYDRYRSRIMIPIHDIHGNIIGFGGRIFQGSNEDAKYLNSPETLLYSKSNQLFGLYLSKEHIQEKQFAILVEGYFDMIMPYQAGFNNIVASLGTSLTENQAKLVRRYTDRMVIFYDPDQAGKSAALRAIPILLKENFSIQVASLPEGMDPDQLIRDRGAEGFQIEIDRAMRYDQLFLQTLAQKHDLKNPSGKLAAAEELIVMMAVIANPFEREQLMNRFASSFGIATQVIQDLYKRKQKGSTAAAKPKPQEQNISKPEKELLRILLMDSSAAAEVLPQLTEDDYQELVLADCFLQIQQALFDQETSTAEIIHSFQSELQSFATSLVMNEEAPKPNLESALDALQSIRQSRSDRMLRNLTIEIEEATKSGDLHKLNLLLDHKRKLGIQMKVPKITLPPGSA